MTGQLSQDFDLFGGMLEEEGEITEPTDVGGDVLNGILDDETAEVTEETTEDVNVDEVIEEVTEDVSDEEVGKEGIDIESLVEEILSGTAEVDQKVEEIKDEVEKDGSIQLLSLIDELQTLLVEKNQEIQELSKKDEITSSRLMDKSGDAENYLFYKDTIEKLENNPKLMMLAKYMDSEDERMNDRVISILSELIFDKTGEDISDLINTKQKDSVANALIDIDGGGEPGVPSTPRKEDEALSFDESITNLF